jgi:hypothetical protein
LGVWGWGPTPQPPIPNPQSPIPITNHKDLIKNKNLLKITLKIKINNL